MAFEQAGFYGIRVLERQAEPWRTVDGIEFRSLTVEAFRGKEGARRNPRETKGQGYDVTTEAEACCDPESCC